MSHTRCPVKNFVWYLWDCPFEYRSVESYVDNSAALDRYRQIADSMSFNGSSRSSKKLLVAQIFGIDIHES